MAQAHPERTEEACSAERGHRIYPEEENRNEEKCDHFRRALRLRAGVQHGGARGRCQVAGTWELSSQGRQGPITQTLTVEQDGGKIKGTIKGQRGEAPFEGTVKGNAISFTVKRQTPNGEFVQEYTGTVDGDAIKGTVKMGENSRDWSAKRQK